MASKQFPIGGQKLNVDTHEYGTTIAFTSDTQNEYATFLLGVIFDRLEQNPTTTPCKPRLQSLVSHRKDTITLAPNATQEQLKEVYAIIENVGKKIPDQAALDAHMARHARQTQMVGQEHAEARRIEAVRPSADAAREWLEARGIMLSPEDWVDLLDTMQQAYKARNKLPGGQ